MPVASRWLRMQAEHNYAIETYEAPPTGFTMQDFDVSVSVSAGDGIHTVGVTNWSDITDRAGFADLIRDQLVAADGHFKDLELYAVNIDLHYAGKDVKLRMRPEKQEETLVFDGTVEQQLTDRVVDDVVRLTATKAEELLEN